MLCSFQIIIGHTQSKKRLFELLFCRPRINQCLLQHNSVCHQNLYEGAAAVINSIGHAKGCLFVADSCELNRVFHLCDKRKETKIITYSSAAGILNKDAYERNGFEAVTRHYNSGKLHKVILLKLLCRSY